MPMSPRSYTTSVEIDGSRISSKKKKAYAVREIVIKRRSRLIREIVKRRRLGMVSKKPLEEIIIRRRRLSIYHPKSH